jgi:hypothetical protein
VFQIHIYIGFSILYMRLTLFRWEFALRFAARPGRHWIHTRVLPRTIIIVQAGVMEKTDWYGMVGLGWYGFKGQNGIAPIKMVWVWCKSRNRLLNILEFWSTPWQIDGMRHDGTGDWASLICCSWNSVSWWLECLTPLPSSRHCLSFTTEWIGDLGDHWSQFGDVRRLNLQEVATIAQRANLFGKPS